MSEQNAVALVLLFGFLWTLSAAKPVQENPETPVRRLDTLAGLTMGSSKSTRSLSPSYHSRIPLDTINEEELNFLRFLSTMVGGKSRSLDSSGGANSLRSIDSLGGGNYLRSLDSLGGSNLLRHPSPMIQQSGYEYRSLDSLGGGNLLRREHPEHRWYRNGGGNPRSDKRLDTLSGITLGHQKRTFDEIDRTAFDDFSKRDFDEIDRGSFDGYSKRS